MSWGNVAIIGASIASSVIGGNAAGDASGIQARAIDEGIDTQEEFGAGAEAILDPFATVGTDAIAGTGGETEGSVLDLIRNNNSGAFETSEGFQAINRAAAAGGKGINSGERLKDLTEFKTGLDTRNNNTRINQLLNLIQGGQGAATTQAGIRGQTGVNITNLLTGKGDVQAAGVIGRADAFATGINDAAPAVGSFLEKVFK